MWHWFTCQRKYLLNQFTQPFFHCGYILHSRSCSALDSCDRYENPHFFKSLHTYYKLPEALLELKGASILLKRQSSDRYYYNTGFQTCCITFFSCFSILICLPGIVLLTTSGYYNDAMIKGPADDHAKLISWSRNLFLFFVHYFFGDYLQPY